MSEMANEKISPCCLTVAGADSGGNAGIEADLRMFHAYGLHGCVVLTALTAQNPFAVSGVCPVSADFLAAQLDAVLGVYAIGAMKTGMLGDPQSIEVLADRLGHFPAIAKVIDPVMIATSGAQLISEEAKDALVRYLLPLATLITPNLPEAAELSACGAASHDDGAELARRLFEKFGRPVLVKGGHGNDAESADVLYDGKEMTTFRLPRLENPISIHGTGCSLAAAITAELTLGHSLAAAVKGAKRAVFSAIERSYYVGKNCGVLGFPQIEGNNS